jgi:hypothetical protein
VRALGEGDEAGADIAGRCRRPCTPCWSSAPINLPAPIGGDADVTEYLSIVATILAYEGKRWPLGKGPGGKG